MTPWNKTRNGLFYPGVEVLPADLETKHKIGWTVHEYSGGVIYQMVEGKPVHEPITSKDALKEGDTVLCPSLMGYFRATIQMSEGKVYAREGDHIGFLEFDQDDRHCWTCGGTANLASIQRLNLDSAP